MSRNTPWLATYEPRSSARLRLFCFPFAGGGASVYRLWSRAIGPSIEVAAVQLPGRENRIRDPLLDGVEAVVSALADAIRPWLDRPFALFGHSMGALLSFELARELRRRGAPTPAHLFASARRAPHVPDEGEPLHRMPDDRFVATLRERYNAIPDAVLAERELMALFLPILRADFRLIETYVHRAEAPLAVPITALGGTEDRLAGRAQLEAWRLHTSGPFAVRLFPAGHFFVQTHRDVVARTVASVLS